MPDEVYEHMDARPAGIEAEQEWKDRFERWAEAFPKLREDWEADRTGKPRPGWIEALPTFPAGEDVATRDAGKKVMQAFKPFTPTMIGGAADLVESTKTEFEGAGVFSATHAGRNIAFGIREHAMGSIVNGIALDAGDAEALRLDLPDLLRLHAAGGAAVRARPSRSRSGRGRTTRSRSARTGPTHQPVEHHMALRAIPNLWYVRPGDANETAHAWRIALEREGGPVALALSRQKVPTLDLPDRRRARAARTSSGSRATACPT